MAAATALLAAQDVPAWAAWEPSGTLSVPTHPYSFLATTPSGDLLATTHNFHPEFAQSAGKVTGTAKEMPALLIRNPTSPKPQVVELIRTRFDVERGYGGVACDPAGGFFVSGDTGAAATSFLMKFTFEGKPDTQFAKGGTLLPGRRCLGVECSGQNVLLAVDWGIIQVYDARTGQARGVVPMGAKNLYMRDITIDPKTLRLFGVAQGGVVTWGGGTPWIPSRYTFRVFSPSVGRAVAGEGISLDPFKRALMVIPYPGQTLLEVHGDKTAIRTAVTTAAPDSHLVDTAMTFDGQTLFVSDITHGRVHMLRRPLGEDFDEQRESLAALSTPPPSAQDTSLPANPVTWYQGYNSVVKTAREGGLPMVVYFRTNSKPCQTLETGLLQSQAFYRHAGRALCVWEDSSKNRFLAYQFGVTRVPHVFLLDGAGNTVTEFRGNVRAEEFLAALERLNKAK